MITFNPTFNSVDFYKSLQEAQALIAVRCNEASVPLPDFCVFCFHVEKQIEPKLQLSRWNDVKVEGKDLYALIDEYIRRHQFEQSQKLLQLGHVVVEAGTGPSTK
jgi:hypothetical protein